MLVLCLVCITYSAVTAGSDNFLIHNGDRVVIYGDSITDNQLYPRIIEDFVVTRHPDWDVEFWNRGWGGDTAHYYGRFKRDCLSLQPTIAIICLGMNDADYKPFDKAGFESYVDFLDKMVKDLKAIEARAVLVSPPTYDVAQKRLLRHPGDHITRDMTDYPEVLREFSLGMLAVAKINNCKYIDLNQEYAKLLASGRARYGSTFKLTRSGDAVHPYGPGQLAMAVMILKGLNAPSEVAYLEIDAESNSVIESRGAKLPMPLYDGTEPVGTMLAVTDRLNKNILKIKNLPTGIYKLVVDTRHVITLDASGWTMGTNLSERSFTPEMKHSKEVAGATEEVHNAKYYKWRKVLCKNIHWVGDGSACSTNDKEALAKADDVIAEALAKRNKLAKPNPHTYILTRVD